MELYIKNPKNCQLIRKIKLTARLLKNNIIIYPERKNKSLSIQKRNSHQSLEKKYLFL